MPAVSRDGTGRGRRSRADGARRACRLRVRSLMAERAHTRCPGAAPAMVGALALLAASSSPVLAHDGPPPAPSGIWAAWNFDPVILLALGVAVACYVPGLAAVWRRAGTGRGIARWRAAAWLCGMVALVAALVSPIDARGAALFAGHRGR